MTVVAPLELVHPVVAGRAMLRGADGSLLRGHRPGRWISPRSHVLSMRKVGTAPEPEPGAAT
jgi:hypothetical protein